MATKFTNDMATLVTLLYSTGPIGGGEIVQKSGLAVDKVKVALKPMMEEWGLVGQDGEGKASKFGLTDAGIAYVEENNLAPEEGQEEGQEEEDDEFAPAPAPAPAPTRAAAPKAAGKAPAKGQGQAPAPKAAGKAPAPKAAPAPARPKVEKLAEYQRADTMNAKQLEAEIANAESFIGSLKERGTPEDLLFAGTAARAVVKLRGRLRRMQA